MTNVDWLTIVPAQGWQAYSQYKALLDDIWEGLSEENGEWHYMNLSATFCVWEATSDGSAIAISSEGDRLAALQVSLGRALDYMQPLLQRFDLLIQGFPSEKENP